MKCLNHPETEAAVLCAACHEPVCEECRVTLRGRDYCRQCLEKKVDGLDFQVDSDKSAPLAFLLSLLPGAGYMYLGLMNRGLQTMIIFFGTIFVAQMTHIESLVPLILPIMLFYSIFDTLQLVRKMRQGYPVEDKTLIDLGGSPNWQNYLGYALVVLGVLALVNNFVPYFTQYSIIKRLISPLLIIAVGVFILYRNTGMGRGKHNGGEGND